jgi:alpha/beta superfamily hydrolase
MKKEYIKPFVWGLVVSAVLTMIIGFAFGGWVTGGTAQEMAEEMADEAVIDRLAPICVVQFNQDPEKDRKLKELKEKSSWDRKDYVEKQGWATMPGEKEPDSNVADECARRLVELEK